MSIFPSAARPRRLAGRAVLCGLAGLLFLSLPAVADMSTGTAAFEAGDYAKAQSEFLAAANEGKAEGQYWMGRIYEGGFGVEADPSTAFKWFEKAGDQGHADAQRIVGAFYEAGKGVDR